MHQLKMENSLLFNFSWLVNYRSLWNDFSEKLQNDTAPLKSP